MFAGECCPGTSEQGNSTTIATELLVASCHRQPYTPAGGLAVNVEIQLLSTHAWILQEMATIISNQLR